MGLPAVPLQISYKVTWKSYKTFPGRVSWLHLASIRHLRPTLLRTGAFLLFPPLPHKLPTTYSASHAPILSDVAVSRSLQALLPPAPPPRIRPPLLSQSSGCNPVSYLETLDEVWARLDRSALFPGKLTPEYVTGIECPFCKKREAWIRRSGFKLRCNRRQKCGRELHLLSWAANLGGAMPRGEVFKAAVLKLAALAGVPPPSFTPEALARSEAREQRRSLLSAFWQLCRDWFQDPEVGAQARDYLVHTRGFPADALADLPLGFYPRSGEVRARLVNAGYDPEDVEAAGVVWSGWDGRLLGAWRDWRGWVETFWGRDLTGKAERKVLYQPGAEIGKLGAYGLDVAVLHGGRDDLILVEGPLDALHLHARGRRNVAALGGSSLSSERLSRLAQAGVRRITLLLDNDPDPTSGRWPGLDGTRAAVHNALHTPNAPVCSVAHPRSLGAGIKDPDELLVKKGVEAFDALLEGRVHGFRFLAEDLIARQLPAGATPSDQAIQDVLAEARTIESELADPERFLDLETFFWVPLREALALDRQVLEDHLARVRDTLRTTVRRDRIRSQLEALRSDLATALDQADVDRARESLLHGADRVRVELRALSADPVLSVADELGAHDDYLSRWRGGEFLGLPQITLPALDQATLGLRGLMLLAAAPNVGKTALAVQLGLDVVEANPDACFLFVSLEMRRHEILARIRCKLAQMDWKTLVFGSSRGGGELEASFTGSEIERLRVSRDHLAALGPRIQILDERNFPQPTAEGVLAQLAELKRRTGSSRAFLLIDYLQVWPIPDTVKLRSELDEDKWRIGQMKTLRDHAGDDAVLVVSELRKPQGSQDPEWKGGSLAHIMGSARSAYTPDVVFLFNPYTEKELREIAREAEGCPFSPDELREGETLLGKLAESGISPVRLEIAKGRDGVLRRGLDLTFWYRQSRFEQGLIWEG